MNKKELEIQNIEKYLNENNVEHSDVLRELLKSDNLYSRKNELGHITSSVFILSPDEKNALLILHKKYNKYIAPGGHVDEGEYSLEAGLREVSEEVGISDLEVLDTEIFDIDIHPIKEAIKNGVVEPEHWHFDVRYIAKSPTNEVAINIDEANGFKWVALSSFENVEDVSTKRMANKAIQKVKKSTLKL